MPDLSMKVEAASPVLYAAAPTIAFRLLIENDIPDQPIHTIVLRCQIQIDASRRRYAVEEQAKMIDLFGEPERWSQTLKSLLWTIVSVTVSGFKRSTTVELHVPCTFDFNVASTKYFAGLSGGEIPLRMMFSGTVFYADEEGSLQVAPISWEKETTYNLPQRVWRDMMDSYYPNTAWLTIRRDVFDRLNQFKMQHGMTSWDQALERVLSIEETVKS
jgi:hypothetical protein